MNFEEKKELFLSICEDNILTYGDSDMIFFQVINTCRQPNEISEEDFDNHIVFLINDYQSLIKRHEKFIRIMQSYLSKTSGDLNVDA